MRKKLAALLGISMLVFCASILTYQSISNQEPPLLSSLGNESTKSGSADYLTFFAVAFGGAGFVILSSAAVQWVVETKKRR